MDTEKNVRKALKNLHDDKGMSWREIASIKQYEGIPAGTLCSIYNDDPIPKVHKQKLGLSKKPEPPTWVTNAANNLAVLESKAQPSSNRIYNRKGKRVT